LLDGKPIEKKKGPFGEYVQWGSIRLSLKGQETFEEIEKALREKATATPAFVLGPFEFREGQYGKYMFKKDVKDKKFVGLPAGLDPKSLTEEQAVKIYQAGLQQKQRAGSFVPRGGGNGGGGRGRGRGRGRGQ
jgi:topoisomerase IA-like protein